ncbi:unnamed protein product [Sympodiomycopsis kandeliae]
MNSTAGESAPPPDSALAGQPLENHEGATAKNSEDSQSSPSHGKVTKKDDTPTSSSVTSMLFDDILAENATIPLAWLSLLTGLVDGIVYAHFQVWVGFQTGNIVQFSMNIAQYIYPWSPTRDALLTTTRAVSFSSFFLASFIGFHIGKMIGEKKRWFLCISSIIQGLFLFAASGILFSRGDANALVPSFNFAPGVIILVSFSMGLQSIQAQKLSSAVFSTSVAFTATLTQIASDPQLFTPGLYLLGNEKVKGRDLRLLAIIALAMGGGIAQSLLDSSLGLSGSVAVAGGFKVFASLIWLIPKGVPTKKAVFSSKA